MKTSTDANPTIPEPTPEVIGALAIVYATGTCNGIPTLGMAGAVNAYHIVLEAIQKLSKS